jgi:hypothetical protein
MPPGFFILIFLDLICCSFLVLAYFIQNFPAPKRARRAVGTVCEAYGKHFATPDHDGFDKHRTSGYLLGTPCHVLDDGSTRAILVATERQTMSTAMLHKLKLSRQTHGTQAFLCTLSTYPSNVSNIRKISKNKSAKTKPERALIRTPRF